MYNKIHFYDSICKTSASGSCNFIFHVLISIWVIVSFSFSNKNGAYFNQSLNEILFKCD